VDGCRKRTHIIGEHWEHMLVVNTNALTFAAFAIEGPSDMGQLLRTLFDQDQKMCDKDMGGCGTAYVSGGGVMATALCCVQGGGGACSVLPREGVTASCFAAQVSH
jgi:hypothetical protein